MSITVIRKAEPDISDVHINGPLTNISIAYMQNTSEYIANRVFPVVPVMKQSDSYFTYDRNDWLRDEAKVRPLSTPTVGTGYSHSNESYKCEVYGFHKDVDKRVRANYDAPLDADRDATEFVTQKLLIRRENLFVSNYLTTGVWGTDYTGGASGTNPDFVYWDDYAHSDPIKDVTDKKRIVKNLTGFKPNTLVVNGSVDDTLKNHPDIIERVKYTSETLEITNSIIAKALGVERYLVAEAIYADNKKGETASYTPVLGDNALLCYVNPRPSLLSPSAGYTFAWKGYGAKTDLGTTMGSFYMPSIKSDRIEGEMSFDLKVIASDLGVFFSDVNE